jgi:tetratricopeptide (TPR) repeat protein
MDKAACDALVAALRRPGADVWYDEHNLGAGQLLEGIQREVQVRPIFIMLLSEAAFGSQWVRRETTWTFNLHTREPNRLILPVTIGQIEPSDFNGPWLFLEDLKRVEAPGLKPYALTEAAERTLRLLELTPSGARSAPAAPQPSESASDLLAKGKALSAQKKYGESIPFFECATQLDPSSFDAWFSLGFARNKLKDWQEGLDVNEPALALNGNSVFAWNNKANALLGLYRYNEALATYDRALALGPPTWRLPGTERATRCGASSATLRLWSPMIGHSPLTPTMRSHGRTRLYRCGGWGARRRRSGGRRRWGGRT